MKNSNDNRESNPRPSGLWSQPNAVPRTPYMSLSRYILSVFIVLPILALFEENMDVLYCYYY
jgi:hypothetical protein